MDKLPYYETLGLDTNASLPEVTGAYTTLVKDWEATKFDPDPVRRTNAEEKLREIETAFGEILKDFAAPQTGNAETTPTPSSVPPEQPAFDIGPAPEEAPDSNGKSLSLRTITLCILLFALVVGALLSPLLVARIAITTITPSSLLLLGCSYWAFRASEKHRNDGNGTAAQLTYGAGWTLLIFLILYVIGVLMQSLSVAT